MIFLRVRCNVSVYSPHCTETEKCFFIVGRGQRAMTGKHRAVLLIITGLPESITSEELKARFQRRIQPRWWSLLTGSSSIRICNIIRITYRDTGDVEYHGLLEIQPAKLALRAIREMNGSIIHGCTISVHRYRHRSPVQDVYSIGSDSESDQVTVERRRSDLGVELIAPAGRFAFLRRLFGAVDSPKSISLKNPHKDAA